MKLVSAILFLLAPVLVLCEEVVYPVDCTDIHRQINSPPIGVYTIYPLGEKSGIPVLCDVDTEGGWWTVIQRRVDGTVSFNRPWDQYKMGFGNASGEYWLGLDSMHYLTKAKNYELMLIMVDFEGFSMVTYYSSFDVQAECEGYPLHVSGHSIGSGGDFLMYHNGQKFSTFDTDNDTWEDGNCAVSFAAGWWYNKCHHSNPNGVYRLGPSKHGVEWKHWNGNVYNLRSTMMKIRPRV